MLKLYDTKSKSIHSFSPLGNEVKVYTCGPTVYDYPHIGHWRKYYWDDILTKSLQAYRFHIKRVMNITDVGHLSDDADTGEDKLEKGSRKWGKTPQEVARFFENKFFQDFAHMQLNAPDVICRATENIAPMIQFIQDLINKGYVYQTQQALYFDTSKFSTYGELSGQKLSEKSVASRDEVRVDPNKKNPADFAVWFFLTGHFANHIMHWSSPWGEGFPGWHIECSTFIDKYLGEQIDIHTGGIDHIPVHHENEIAQSEAKSGKTPFVGTWFHSNFLLIDGLKMSKSLGNLLRLEDLFDKGYSPSDLKYFFCQAHYRKEQNFTFEALSGAKIALSRLREKYVKYASIAVNQTFDPGLLDENLGDDLNTAKALATIHTFGDKENLNKDELLLIIALDEILGFRLFEYFPEEMIPSKILDLAKSRQTAKSDKDFAKADSLRDQINALGYQVLDSTSGFKVKKIPSR